MLQMRSHYPQNEDVFTLFPLFSVMLKFECSVSQSVWFDVEGKSRVRDGIHSFAGAARIVLQYPLSLLLQVEMLVPTHRHRTVACVTTEIHSPPRTPRYQ